MEIRKGDNKMARGVRKTPLEKLQEELEEVERTIKQYSDATARQKEKKKELIEQIKLEQLNELSAMLEEKNMSIDDVKSMIESTKK